MFVRYWKTLSWIVFAATALAVTGVAYPKAQEQSGSIRGSVADKDFDSVLAGAQVLIVETGQRATTNDQGKYVFPQVAPGRYTLVFSRDGYEKFVRSEVLVASGQLTDIDAQLVGEFTELDEFVVQDVLQIGAGTEQALLKLRFESSALLDSISSDLMGRAGVGDAASALRLVSGASVQDGKYAVVRGLPDRYVNSQMNGVRLPSSDEDKRAVQLDQFPSAVIESIQVSKTFTPDQQGDASGGAVNLRLKSIPNENLLQFRFSSGINSQVLGANNFITHEGGGRSIQNQNLGGNWTGDVGVSEGDPRRDYKYSLSGGGKIDLANGVKIGGFASLFYERKTSFYDNGIDDSYWVDGPGQPLSPEYSQGGPSLGELKTALFDVTKSSITEQKGELATFGVETEEHRAGLTYLHTRALTQTSTLAIDTRGKEYFFPDYDPYDVDDPGNALSNGISVAPYLRLETLSFVDRRTMTLQFHGDHKLPLSGFSLGPLSFEAPVFDWTAAKNWSDFRQPDKRQFGALWTPPTTSANEGTWQPYKPAANFTIGHLQRIFKDIGEDSKQYFFNLKFPFEQWDKQKGFFKFGMFQDRVTRKYNQDTFANFGDNQFLSGDFSQPWSANFPYEDHPITDGPPFIDVDYTADQVIAARYAMVDMPLTSFLNFVGGVRFEASKMSTVNIPEINATWYPDGASSQVDLGPGDGDAAFDRIDWLPSYGLVLKPFETVRIHASRSRTIARQTFKEFVPILQQEYLGGPIFIGNPDLDVAKLKNYDIRLDFTPYSDGLFSISWFKKKIRDPIEYVGGVSSFFTYSTPENYPKGTLQGYEIEARQNLGHFWSSLEGLSLGANATFIDSKVSLPADEIQDISDTLPGQPSIQERDMTNAPERIYNLFMTYDIPSTGSQLGLFYSVQGDTLVQGASTGLNDTKFVPSVYAKEYGTLNVTYSQKLGKYLKLQLQGKNLTNPDIEEVYRSPYTGGDVTKTLYTKGIEYSIGIGVEVAF